MKYTLLIYADQFTNMYDRIHVRYNTFINVIFMGNATVLAIQLTCEYKMTSVRIYELYFQMFTNLHVNGSQLAQIST